MLGMPMNDEDGENDIGRDISHDIMQAMIPIAKKYGIYGFVVVSDVGDECVMTTTIGGSKLQQILSDATEFAGDGVFPDLNVKDEND